MNELESILKFFQTPTGRLLKEFSTEHLLPFIKAKLAGSMKPVVMSEQEQQQRAADEFMTVDDFDLSGEVESEPFETAAPNHKNKHGL